MNKAEAGVKLLGNSFVFDFEKDGETDIVKLTKKIKVVDFIGSILKYSYEFDNSVPSNVRTSFIKALKFNSDISEDDVETFVRIAVSKLCSDFNISSVGCIVFPESKSRLMEILLKHLHLAIDGKVASLKLVKSVPSKIEFDYELFEETWLDTYVNGKPRYTEKQKEDTIKKAEKYMEYVHKLDYFSIARDFKSKYRRYIKNFYSFANQKDKELFKSINNKPILVVDDIATTGTTMAMLLKTLRVLGGSEITMFSILGNSKIAQG